jgi:hypothetical protein
MLGEYKKLKDDEPKRPDDKPKRPDDKPKKPDDEPKRPNVWFHVGIGTIFMSLAGSGLHFLYHASNCNAFVGLLVAVNESMYEHVKLLIFPVVLWWMVITPLAWFLSRRRKTVPKPEKPFGLPPLEYFALPNIGMFYTTIALTASASTASVIGSAFIAVAFWVEVALNCEQLWLDILIFCLGALLGQASGFCMLSEYFELDEKLWKIFSNKKQILTYPVIPIAIGLFAMYMTFTYNPPEWPFVFQDASNKTDAPKNYFYGVSKC